MKTAEAKPVTIKSAKSTQPFFRKAAHNSFSKETENGYSSFFKASNSFIQTKLSIGQPNDIYENEADAMADKVVQRLSENKPVTVHKNERAVQTKPVIPAITNFVQAKCSSCEKEEKLQKKEEELAEYAGDSLRKRIFDSHVKSPYHDENTIQRKCAECENEETIQQKSTDNTGQTATPWLESRLNSSMGNGTPLSGEVRNSMESSFGADFSRVRIHTGSDAVQMNKDLNAQAFTHGSDIYFNSGKYDYKSTGGKHLLAHELTHVVQQKKEGIKCYNPQIQKEKDEVTGSNSQDEQLVWDPETVIEEYLEEYQDEKEAENNEDAWSPAETSDEGPNAWMGSGNSGLRVCWEIKNIRDRINFVVTKLQRREQTVFRTDRSPMEGNFAFF